MKQKKFLLPESEIPAQWYNIMADMKHRPEPMLDPKTRRPISAEDLSRLFSQACSEQELNTVDRWIDIPEPVREKYSYWRCTPLVRAYGLEEALGTPAHIYFKNESVSPIGSHKLNSAIPQAYYCSREGVTNITTETGAGQWGAALSYAAGVFGLECAVYQVKISYEQKPYRRSIMQVFGAQVTPSPSMSTRAGKDIITACPNHQTFDDNPLSARFPLPAQFPLQHAQLPPQHPFPAADTSEEDRMRHTGFEKLAFWGRMTEEQRERLARHVRRAEYQEGQIVRSADSECAGVLLVESGVGAGFLTPIISILIILGAISTAVNMISGIVTRCVNAVERRMPTPEKKQKGHLARNAVFTAIFTFLAFAIAQFGLMAVVSKGYAYLGYAACITLFIPFVVHAIGTRFKEI